MLPKKKVHFLRLTLIFSMLVLFALIYIWAASFGTEPGMEMMWGSMGSMIQGMHAQNISIRALFTQEEATEMSMGTSMSHSASQRIRFSHYFTTLTIVLLLPFILTGTVFLLIIWLK